MLGFKAKKKWICHFPATQVPCGCVCCDSSSGLAAFAAVCFIHCGTLFSREEVETGGFSYFRGLCLMNCYILQESNCLLDAFLCLFFFLFKWTLGKYWVTWTQTAFFQYSLITLKSKRTKNLFFSCISSGSCLTKQAPHTIVLPSCKSRKGVYPKKKVISCSDWV